MKFKIYLEYCGSNYSGWQKQDNAKTIQGTLEKAIRNAFKKTKGQNKFIDLQASGRTDAGVHAIEQVCHVECETMLAPEILKMKINDELPSDINVLEIEKARKDFHARHSAKARQYLYVISKRRTALEKKYVWWVKDVLDVNRMKETSKLFYGMHDFRSFADKAISSEDDGKSTKCLIESIEVTDTSEKIFIRIKASHFLWKMVRRIAGVLVEAGRRKLSREDILSFLENRSEEPAKYTAPPSGLFLERVYY
ncbi:MAG: tRNA pseudouridine(38-40) synthase TruA [Ignavibacteria bacterium]|jgi:tRNA pseudouridine38-40 synthase